MIDLIHRLGFRCLYLGFRVYTALFRPRIRGTFVFIWVGDRFLAARSSYRRDWSVPGGMVGRKEEWADAARRELDEEVGITLAADGLTFVTEMSGFRNPNERVQVFEVRMESKPLFTIDNREMAEAGFMTVSEAQKLPLMEGVERYLGTLDN
jgi:8-oxo-dGTP diphosphatase